jgi:hypothetical protein
MIQIVILRETKQMPVLNIEGDSGRTYTFVWDTDTGYYTYNPKDQKETDDLFLAQGFRGPFMFSAREVEVAEPRSAPDGVSFVEVNTLIESLPALDGEQIDGLVKGLGIDTKINDTKAAKSRLAEAFLKGVKYDGVLPRLAN